MSVWRDAGPQAALLEGGRRLHLQHGPIDLIIGADGEPGEVAAAYRQARTCFETVLSDLMAEIDLLRAPVGGKRPMPSGEIARAMAEAARRFPEQFVTPMASVAGCVADYVLKSMINRRKLNRVFINNGGDIALHLSAGASYKAAICTDPLTGTTGGVVEVRHDDGISGIATSGWRGRSHSFGIADAVTVLADNAGTADVAATLIANEVTVDYCKAVSRVPASELQADSDLGDRLVTTDVGQLNGVEIDEALERGTAVASNYLELGLIAAAFIGLQGNTRVVGDRIGRRAIQISASVPATSKRELIHA